MISKKKFDMDLPSDLEPFGYIEERRIIKTKNCGDIMLISFGAMNYLGHYSPEMGGVSLVLLNPDLLLAVNYIPWDTAARKVELERQFIYLNQNQENMYPKDITQYFWDNHYTIPTQKAEFKENYFSNMKYEQRGNTLRKRQAKIDKIQDSSMEGHRIAGKFEGEVPVFPKEDMIPVNSDDTKGTKGIGTKEDIEETKNSERSRDKEVEPRKPKMINGEELIPLDDDEE